MKIKRKSLVFVTTGALAVSGVAIASSFIAETIINNNQGLAEIKNQINHEYNNNSLTPTLSNYNFKEISQNKVSDYSLGFFLINKLGMEPESLKGTTHTFYNKRFFKGDQEGKKFLTQTSLDLFNSSEKTAPFLFKKFNNDFGNKFDLNLISLTCSLEDGKQNLEIVVNATARINPEIFQTKNMDFSFGNELFATNVDTKSKIIQNFNSNLTNILFWYKDENSVIDDFIQVRVKNTDFNFLTQETQKTTSPASFSINFLGEQIFIFLKDKTIEPSNIKWVASLENSLPVDDSLWTTTSYVLLNAPEDSLENPKSAIKYKIKPFNNYLTAQDIINSKDTEYRSTLKLVLPLGTPEDKIAPNDEAFQYRIMDVSLANPVETEGIINVSIEIKSKTNGSTFIYEENNVKVFSITSKLIQSGITSLNISDYIDVQIKPSFSNKPLTYFENIVPTIEELTKHFSLTLKTENTINEQGLKLLKFDLEPAYITIQNTASNKSVQVSIRLTDKMDSSVTGIVIYNVTSGFAIT